MATSQIEWTDATWNPTTGCNKVSPGCKFCYAERFSERLQNMGVEKYANGFQLTLHPEVLEDPLKWRKPQLIFVNSMSDLFHEQIPLPFQQQVFDTMRRAHWHRFQVLTKRAERLLELDNHLAWAPNVWMGVSVENQQYAYRIDLLRQASAQVKFLSLEPLLGPLPDLDLREIDWVIVGGESGFKPRPIKAEWVRDIRDQCLSADIPFFFKQWGGRNKKKAGRELDGRTWNALPREQLALDLT
jgi:protein gp37